MNMMQALAEAETEARRRRRQEDEAPDIEIVEDEGAEAELAAQRARVPGRRPGDNVSNSHEGVSCDGCMMPNFSGNRFKCLRCWDFDLCDTCQRTQRFQVEEGAEQQHDKDHPMQCILTHRDFNMYYADDNTKNYLVCRIAVLTCPYCGTKGFSFQQFYVHVSQVHAQPAGYQVNCPLCVGLVSTTDHRVVDDLKQHWTTVHYQYDPNRPAEVAEVDIVGEAIAAAPGDAPVPLAARNRAAAAAAAAAAAEAGMGGAAAQPFDPIAPIPRAGARRPMMARRAARQQPGVERTDRENRMENRDQRNAAAAFGMPWPENDEAQDLFRMVQRATNEQARTGDRAGLEARRMQRLRNLQQEMERRNPGNLAGNAEFMQQLLGDMAPSASNLARAVDASSASGEYAAPRTHSGGPAPRPRSPPVQVLVALGSRPQTLTAHDNVRLEEARRHDRTPSVSTLTSGEEDDEEEREERGEEEGEGEEEGGERQARRRHRRRRASASSESQREGDAEGGEGEGEAGEGAEEGEGEGGEGAREGEEGEPPNEEQRETVDEQRTAEDDELDELDALTREQAIADTALTQEEVVDMRRAANPFAGKMVNPLKALRANATDREWELIKKMLRNSDMRAKVKESAAADADRRTSAAADAGFSDDELVTHDLLKGARPVAPKDDQKDEDDLETEPASWVSAKFDTSKLAFAPGSYWSDKRFIAPRKQELLQSMRKVPDEVLMRNAMKCLSIMRCLAGDKVLDDTTGLTDAQVITKTLEMFDMEDFQRKEETEEVQMEKRVQQSAHSAAREIEYGYDEAMLSMLKDEADEIEKELERASKAGPPLTAMARNDLERKKKYLADLRAGGAGGSVVLQNPRTDPDEQAELTRRLREEWGTEPTPHEGPLPRPGPGEEPAY